MNRPTRETDFSSIVTQVSKPDEINRSIQLNNPLVLPGTSPVNSKPERRNNPFDRSLNFQVDQVDVVVSCPFFSAVWMLRKEIDRKVRFIPRRQIQRRTKRWDDRTVVLQSREKRSEDASLTIVSSSWLPCVLRQILIPRYSFARLTASLTPLTQLNSNHRRHSSRLSSSSPTRNFFYQHYAAKSERRSVW